MHPLKELSRVKLRRLSKEIKEVFQARVLRDFNTFRECTCKHGSKRKSNKRNDRRFNELSLRKTYKRKSVKSNRGGGLNVRPLFTISYYWI